MEKAELYRALDEYTTLAQKIAVLEKEKAAVALRIQQGMDGAEEIQVGDYMARYKPVTSSRFDVRAFAEAHKKLYTAFCRPQTVRRFTVST